MHFPRVRRTATHGSQSRIRGYIGLTSGMIYFGTGQYRYTVSSLLLIYIYIYYNKYKSLP